MRLLKKKIPVLQVFSGDLWAGAEVMVYNLLDELRKDPSISLCALSLNEGELAARLRASGIETHVVAESEHSFPALCMRSLSLLKDKGIKIVHSHRYKENLLGFFLARALGAERAISTVHGLTEAHGPEKKSMTSNLKRGANNFLLKRFNAVSAVSNDIKRVLVDKYGLPDEKVKVIHNGVRIPESAPVQRAGKRVHIGTVGRMVPVKDFGLFLEAAFELKKMTDDVHFSILGDGPMRPLLEQKIRDLSLINDVRLLKPRLDTLSYYRSLDIYLNTSVHEGMPLSVLEAMSCGVPVVAPKVGGLPEIITSGENGLLADRREARELATQCLRIIKDAPLRDRLGRGALRRAEDFSSTRMAGSYRDLYLC